MVRRTPFVTALAALTQRIQDTSAYSGNTTADDLGDAPSYPAIALMRAHGKKLSAVTAAATFAVTVSGPDNNGSPNVLRALVLSAAVGGCVAYLQEITEVVASTLLPE